MDLGSGAAVRAVRSVQVEPVPFARVLLGQPNQPISLPARRAVKGAAWWEERCQACALNRVLDWVGTFTLSKFECSKQVDAMLVKLCME